MGSAASKVCVAHVTFGLDVGGLEKLLVEFARHVDRDRFALEFISLGGRGRLAGDVEACGWPVSALEEAQGLRPGLVVKLVRLLRARRFDVVHTHDNRPLVYGGLAARVAGVPRLIHSRHGRSFGTSGREIALVGLVSRLTDRIVCVSEDATQLSARQGIAPSKLCTIWNGIDLERFAAGEPNPHGPAAIVARLSPEKDIATLLRAWSLVVREIPSARLVIAGDGPCRHDLESLARELSLTDQVEFKGEVHDVAGLLGDARLFVLSSISEGVSLTLLEAMARGLPVVATRVGGNTEVVVDGETGVLVPPSEPESLAQALLHLFGDADESRRMGLAGRRRVEEHFDVRKMVAAYERLYCEDAR